MKNPYDVEDTCRCHAWSEGECACGGYVEPGEVRAWQRGYHDARAEIIAAIEAIPDRLQPYMSEWGTRAIRAEIRAALSAHDD